VDRLI